VLLDTSVDMLAKQFLSRRQVEPLEVSKTKYSSHTLSGTRPDSIRLPAFLVTPDPPPTPPQYLFFSFSGARCFAIFPGGAGFGFVTFMALATVVALDVEGEVALLGSVALVGRAGLKASSMTLICLSNLRIMLLKSCCAVLMIPPCSPSPAFRNDSQVLRSCILCSSRNIRILAGLGRALRPVIEVVPWASTLLQLTCEAGLERPWFAVLGTPEDEESVAAATFLSAVLLLTCVTGLDRHCGLALDTGDEAPVTAANLLWAASAILLSFLISPPVLVTLIFLKLVDLTSLEGAERLRGLFVFVIVEMVLKSIRFEMCGV